MDKSTRTTSEIANRLSEILKESDIKHSQALEIINLFQIMNDSLYQAQQQAKEEKDDEK